MRIEWAALKNQILNESVPIKSLKRSDIQGWTKYISLTTKKKQNKNRLLLHAVLLLNSLHQFRTFLFNGKLQINSWLYCGFLPCSLFMSVWLFDVINTVKTSRVAKCHFPSFASITLSDGTNERFKTSNIWWLSLITTEATYAVDPSLTSADPFVGP